MMMPVWQVQKPRTWWIWIIFLKTLYRQSKLIICNSEASRRELVEKLGLDENKCRVVHNSVDVDRIRRQAEPPPADQWFAPESPPVVVCVANLLPVKDIPTLIRAFAIVRRKHACHLLILGEGSERGRLEELVRACKLEQWVRMPGFVANPFSMIRRARVLVSASLTEGCPNALQQALACSTPIVATDCPGGTSEVLENGRWGRLVPVGDAEAMAAAIVRTLSGDLLPDGYARAAQFDRSAIASIYLALLAPRSVVS
jgi:glycosyltransferase involved in cell wall biosynthesis